MAKEMLQASRWSDDSSNSIKFPSVTEPLDVSVIVVGGGATGLSTALHLSEKNIRVALVEAGDVGAAASGRSGGQVVPGFKVDPETLKQKYGDEVAQKMRRFAFGAADYTFELIDRLSIDCAPTRNGWFQVAVNPKIARYLQERTTKLKNAGADVEYFSQERICSATGSDYFHGGLYERAAGAVHPLALAQGLAKAAQKQGVLLFTQSRVESILRVNGKWCLKVNGQQLQAPQVVLATDAYTSHLFPSLERSFLAVSSAQIASEPLPREVLDQVLPMQAGISEARKVPHYCRIDPQGRFLIGGRGPNASAIDTKTINRLRSAAVARFPVLKNIRWEYGWLGTVGLTLDDTPRLANPSEGLWTAYGYSGRGLALAVRMGKTLADAVEPRSLELDYPVTPLRPLPWYGLRQPAVATALAWYRMRDSLGFIS